MESFSLLNEILKKVEGLPVSRVFHSIGTHLFIGLGPEITILSEEDSYQRPGYEFWIAWADWRVTRNHQHIFGSNDFASTMRSRMTLLKNKKFQALEVVSNLMDISLYFEGNIKLTTFISSFKEDEWILLTPGEPFVIEFDTEEKLQQIQALASCYSIEDKFKAIFTPIDGMVIKDVSLECKGIKTLHLSFDHSLSLGILTYAWRIEKSGTLFAASSEHESQLSPKLLQLVGQRLRQVEVAHAMMEARFLIGDHFVLKYFVSACNWNTWEISQEERFVMRGQPLSLWDPGPQKEIWR